MQPSIQLPDPRPGYIEVFAETPDGGWKLLDGGCISDCPGYFTRPDFRLRFYGRLHNVSASSGAMQNSAPAAPVLAITFTPFPNPHPPFPNAGDSECFWVSRSITPPDSTMPAFLEWLGWVFHRRNGALAYGPRYQVCLIGHLSQLIAQPLPWGVETGQEADSFAEQSMPVGTDDAPSQAIDHEYVTVEFTAGQ